MPSLEVVQINDDTMESDDDQTVYTEEESSSTSPVKGKSKPIEALPEKPAPFTVISQAPEVEATKVEKPAAKQVTPADETVNGSTSSTTSSKQNQQRKVSQMTLGNFFFGAKKSSSVPKSPPVTALSSPKKRSAASGSKEPARSTEKPSHEAKASDAKRIDFGKAETTNDTSTTESKDDKTDMFASTEAAPEATDLPKDVKSDPPKKPPPKRKRKASARKTASSPKAQEEAKSDIQPPVELPEERKTLLKKYSGMKTKYARRSHELVEEARKGLPEENFAMPEPQPKKEEGEGDGFPDHAIANMVLLIEGSPLPLSTLAENVSQKLFECHEMKWITEAVSSKIKLLSMRKPYMDISSSSKSTVDLFEDDSQDRMWRWEILTIDILPSQVLPMVRKARSARKKLSYHRIATTRLIQALTDAETVIANPALPKMDKQIAKVSQNEEKVLKFEREAEKKRMEEQAKKRKQEEVESKKREKELEKELKKLEAEKKKQETEAKKDEAAKAREEAKRKREVEKEQKEVQKKTEEEQQKKKLNSQKACLMSFFSGPPKKKARTPSNASADDSTGGSQAARSNSVASDSFDVNAFRTMVNSSDTQSKGPLFSILSSQAIASRKRRIGKVALSVYVTVEPENAFDAQPFAEEKRIIFSNKYRLLSFHEDRRPAYHGTWSKKSTKVTGRTPFGKDAMYLDYDYQSEGEWEEGDDEIGEDIEDEDKCKDDDDDEGEARIYDYDDGFCVADDRYLDSEDDVDEETKVLHKKKLQKGEGQGSLANRVCIVAPATGGIPATGNTSFSDRIEGFEKQEGVNILLSHQAIALCDARLCLDAFPPALIDDSQAPAQATASSPGEVAGKDEYSSDEMRALARLAHHCELNSKEKLIEALRNADPTMFTSRAKATRKLDTIAVKKRFVNTTGVYWEVKKEVLEQLELHDVLAKKLVDETPKEVVAASKKEGGSSMKKEAKAKPATNNAKKRNASVKPADGAKPATKNAKKRKASVKPADGAKLATKNAKKRKTSVKPADDAKPQKTKTNDSSANAGVKASPKKKSSPKEDEALALKASANLLAGFLIKKKPKKDSEETNSSTVSA